MNQQWLEKNMYLKGMTQVPNLLLDYYHELNISDQEMLALIHLLRYLQKGSESKAQALTDYFMETLLISRVEANNLIHNMTTKRLIQTKGSKRSQAAPSEVSLLPLYETLTKAFSRDLLNPAEKTEEESKVREQGELIRAFEQTFGKLSSFDYEKIREWLEQDAYQPEIVMEALRQSALQRKLSFVYIDRILLNWQINGLDTMEKIKAGEEAFQRRAALRTLERRDQQKDNKNAKVDKKARPVKKTGKAAKKKRYEDIVE